MLATLVALAGLMLALGTTPARAQLKIEITGAGANQSPIAVVPFAGEDRIAQALTPVIIANLQRSGLFRMIDAQDVRPIPVQPADLRYADFSARGADSVVIGSASPLPDGRVEVRFRLMDVAKQSQLAGFSYMVSPAQLRLTAHRISDAIYERLTGDVGVFSTKITYVERQGNRFELKIADADGANAQTVLASSEPIISPKWSPDGTRLAYVSFERKKPIIYVQSLTNGSRTVLANFRGSNSAPAWSPDGNRLAVVLTRDGPSQVYLIDADGSNVQRLTKSSAIDTEPAFTPDGRFILFTSDRGGSPQIYRVPVSGGDPERLTFEGTYNVSPRPSPDGRSFTFVQRSGGRFNVAVQDFATRQVQVLTDTAVDESPSFAPNSRIILYATEVRGRGILAAVSSDGRVRQRLSAGSNDVREPAWGPLLKAQ
ncbi:MAG: Tol-Pal system beta propeller repeat protein TolB [bacterium]|jgi:TolB protein|nr:Tol-Pal system beta propeller repeat protein TolB [Betaproteobacteria bacterium]